MGEALTKAQERTMRVENWTRDFTSFNATQNRYNLKRQDGSISRLAHRRISREAREYLAGFGLDFSKLVGPVLVFDDMLTATATWTHSESGQQVELTSIYFDEKTGEILQAGTNFGRLSL